MVKDYQLELMYGEETISDRVTEISDQINSRFKGEELFVLGVLKGGVIFVSDLIRKINVPLTLDFIEINSYSGKKASKKPSLSGSLPKLTQLKEKNILIVEDIIDAGSTIQHLLSFLNDYEFKSLEICTLLYKSKAQHLKQKIDYIGFEISNDFVVGYGMDLSGYFRNLPYIAKIYNHKETAQ